MDTIANMLTSIVNAQRVGKPRVAVPYSRYKESLARLLQDRGLIGSVRVQEGIRAKLILTLAYRDDGQPRIQGVRRISRPGQRAYTTKHHVPYTASRQASIILSTSRGLMEATQARQQGVGGEVVCEIW